MLILFLSFFELYNNLSDSLNIFSESSICFQDFPFMFKIHHIDKVIVLFTYCLFFLLKSSSILFIRLNNSLFEIFLLPCLSRTTNSSHHRLHTISVDLIFFSIAFTKLINILSQILCPYVSFIFLKWSISTSK